MKHGDFVIDFARLFRAIPPIAQSDVIDDVTSRIQNFFEKGTFDDLPQFTIKDYFEKRPIPKTPVTNADITTIVAMMQATEYSVVLEILEQRPQLCPKFAEMVPVASFKSINTWDSYCRFVSVVFYSDSLHYLRFLLLDMVAPAKPFMKRNKHPRAIVEMVATANMPSLWMGAEIMRIERKFRDRRIAHHTAISASHSSVFIGLSTGEIAVYDFPLNQRSEPLLISSKRLVNQQYSLCWIQDTLWVFTDSFAGYVDFRSASISVIANKPSQLRFPATTDGKYVYSVVFGLSRYRSVHVISVVRRTFKLEGTVRLLEYGFDDDIPFITNGVFITFCDRGLQAKCKRFSLTTGMRVGHRDVVLDEPILGWCYSVYSAEQICLTDHALKVLHGESTVPKWLLGMPRPSSDLGMTPVQAVYFALYHDMQVFSTGDLAFLVDMLCRFIDRSDNTGIRVATALVMREKQEVLLDIFDGCEYVTDGENSLSTFTVFSYLNTLQFTKRILTLPNMISSYIEKNSELEFIWLFPCLFNFKRIELSGQAVVKLISYVCEMTHVFKRESMFILYAFLDHAFENINERLEELSSSITAVYILIQHRVVSTRKGEDTEARFVQNSTEFKVWRHLMLHIFRCATDWPLFAHHLVQCFDFGIWERYKTTNDELTCMFDCALFLLLALLSSIPHCKNPSLDIDDIQSFWLKFEHPLNQYDGRMDERLLEIVKKCYDIADESEAAEMFFKMRNLIICDEHDIAERLDTLEDHESYTSATAIEFLRTGSQDIHFLPAVPGVCNWAIELLHSKIISHEQEIIFGIFRKEMRQHVHACMVLESTRDLSAFVSMFRYIFMFSPEILVKCDVTVNARDIIEYPVEILDMCFENICECAGCIADPVCLLVPLLEHVSKHGRPRLSEFVRRGNEPIHYHRALCWHIGWKCGAVLDFRANIEHILMYARLGSLRVTRALLSSMCISQQVGNVGLEDFHTEMMNIVGNFIVSFVDPFTFRETFCASDICASIFTIIDAYREMMCCESLRTFLLGYLDANDPVTVTAVFAVLNNLIDGLRCGGRVRLLDDEYVEYEGVVESMDAISLTVNGQLYLLSQLNDLSCIPRFVDLNLFDDFSRIIDIFVNMRFEDHKNVFVEASLNAFLEIDRFVSGLPDGFIERIARQDVSTDHIHGLDVHNFTRLLCFQTVDALDFEIFDTGNESTTSLTRDTTPMVSGLLVASWAPCLFRTSSLSPVDRMRLVLEAESGIVVSIVCTCEIESMAFSVSCECNGMLTVMLIPECGCVVWNTMGGKSEAAAIPANCVEIHINIFASQGVVCAYSCEMNVGAQEDSDVTVTQTMELCDPSENAVPPSSRSHITFSFWTVQNRLLDWLRQLNKLRASMLNKSAIHNAMHYLFLGNQYPTEQSMIFKDMLVSRIWGFDALAVREYVLHSLMETSVLVDAVIDLLSSRRKSSCAVHLPSSSVATLRSCFVVNANELTVIPLTRRTVYISRDSMVIPIISTTNTVVEHFVSIRHLFAIMKQRCEVPPDVLKAKLATMSVYTPLIHLMNLTFGVCCSCPATFPPQQAFGRDDLKEWLPIHTYQVHTCDPFDETAFAMLPLSSHFSWNTALFIRDQSQHPTTLNTTLGVLAHLTKFAEYATQNT